MQRGFLCILESDRLVLETPEPDCSNANQHTPCPSGYAQVQTWARQMARTHRQARCPRCGLFVVWVPITRRGPRVRRSAVQAAP